jgi:hypothetical protein
MLRVVCWHISEHLKELAVAGAVIIIFYRTNANYLLYLNSNQLSSFVISIRNHECSEFIIPVHIYQTACRVNWREGLPFQSSMKVNCFIYLNDILTLDICLLQVYVDQEKKYKMDTYYGTVLQLSDSNEGDDKISRNIYCLICS